MVKNMAIEGAVMWAFRLDGRNVRKSNEGNSKTNFVRWAGTWRQASNLQLPPRRGKGLPLTPRPSQKENASGADAFLIVAGTWRQDSNLQLPPRRGKSLPLTPRPSQKKTRPEQARF
jgi:hypothetical protein